MKVIGVSGDNMLKFEEKETGIIIALDKKALETLFEHRQNKFSQEAGGLLFSPLDSESIINIMSISTPRKSDYRSQFFFKHDSVSAQKTINKYFKKNLHYIGDWHTHPQKIPQPSPIDLQSINDIFLKSTHELNFMVHMIVGLSEDPRDLYICITDGFKVRQCISL